MLAKPPLWPLILHAVGGIVCMIFSCIFHWCSIKSKNWSIMVTKLDYAGICILTMFSPFGQINYSLVCDEMSFVRNSFSGICMIAGVATIILLMSPSFQHPDTAVLRAIVFVCLGLAVASAIFYLALVVDDSRMTYMAPYSTWPMSIGNLVYVLGAFTYAKRFPEKFKPGTFDNCGASHQLMHICVLIAAYIHFEHTLNLYESATTKVCPVYVVS